MREDVRATLIDMAQKWNEAAVRWERNAALFADVSELEQQAPKGDGHSL